MSRPNIALLTDFGYRDNFVGVIKGVMLSINPQINFIDITHGVKSHNLREAAFLLKTSFKCFPLRTIFLAVVDPGVGGKRKAVAVRTSNYFFVGPDNGILSLAVKEDGLRDAVMIKNKKFLAKDISFTFHARDVFSPAAAHISRGVPLTSLGPGLFALKTLDFPRPRRIGNLIKGRVVYSDKFGNLITNIENSFIDDVLPAKKVKAVLNSRTIKRINRSYSRARPKAPFLVKGSSGYLEISLKEASAGEFFGYDGKNSMPLEINIHD